MHDELQAQIDLLSHRSSSKRRSAAKKIRKIKTNEAGAALQTALAKEMKDSRTWETQYHLIMAIGEANYQPAISLLEQIAQQDLENSMVHVACGDAIVRLTGFSNNIPNWITQDKSHLVEGALRAIAMEHLVPSNEIIEKILCYVELPENKHIRFWVAAAAPGWAYEPVRLFLQDCLEDPLEDTQKAARAALENRYLKWHPL